MNGLAKTLLAFLVCAGTALAGGKPTVKAVFASGDVPLNTDASTAFWRTAGIESLEKDTQGKDVPNFHGDLSGNSFVRDRRNDLLLHEVGLRFVRSVVDDLLGINVADSRERRQLALGGSIKVDQFRHSSICVDLPSCSRWKLRLSL